ncbi:MAG: hypothetical protein ACI9QL_002399, partial [Candidatus Omnitrophota bacterium]
DDRMPYLYDEPVRIHLAATIGNSRFYFRLSQSRQRPHALQGQLPLRFNTIWIGNYLFIL